MIVMITVIYIAVLKCNIKGVIWGFSIQLVQTTIDLSWSIQSLKILFYLKKYNLIKHFSYDTTVNFIIHIIMLGDCSPLRIN